MPFFYFFFAFNFIPSFQAKLRSRPVPSPGWGGRFLNQINLLIMKSLLIVALAALAGLWPEGTFQRLMTSQSALTVAASNDSILSGSIVMEDAIILLTDTGDPKENIVTIRDI